MIGGHNIFNYSPTARFLGTQYTLHATVRGIAAALPIEVARRGQRMYKAAVWDRARQKEDVAAGIATVQHCDPMGPAPVVWATDVLPYVARLGSRAHACASARC